MRACPVTVERLEERCLLATGLVHDINTMSHYGQPDHFAEVHSTVFFSANDGFHGHELWRTDGTAKGTAQVLDLVPGAAGSSPRELTNLNGRLVFVAGSPATGTELWTIESSLDKAT